MNGNVWRDLSRPLFCLAPMEGVTDTVFRRIVQGCGTPNLMYTEFVNVDGLCSEGGRENCLEMLRFEKIEKPLVAQVWGLKPTNFERVADELVEMGFDGIDLNFGCPVRKVTNKGACSALVNNRDLARDIISATKSGAGGRLPVSVKCRIGFKEIVTEEWTEWLLSQEIDALIIHGRTTKEQSLVPCHWDEIGKAVVVRNKMGIDTPILGNGDVLSIKEALQMVEVHGVDGVMIGRGIFHNPYLFAGRTFADVSVKEKLRLLLWHLELWEEFYEDKKPFHVLKRFFKIYCREFDGAADLRASLMGCENGDEVRDILETYMR